MIRSIKINLKNTCGSAAFLCSVIFIFFLFLLKIIYADSKNGNEYSVLTACFYLSKEKLLSDARFSTVEILRQCGEGWLVIVAPMIVALPFIRLFCEEKTSGELRFQLIRTGRNKLILSKYLTGIVSSGVVMTVGMLLYSAFVYFVYPDITYFPEQTKINLEQQYLLLYGQEASMVFGKVLLDKMLIMFWWGAVAGIPAVVISAMSSNFYTCLCIPFFISYVSSQGILKMLQYNVPVMIQNLLFALRPGHLLVLFTDDISMLDVIVDVVFLAGGLFIFYFVRSSQADCGGQN